MIWGAPSGQMLRVPSVECLHHGLVPLGLDDASKRGAFSINSQKSRLDQMYRLITTKRCCHGRRWPLNRRAGISSRIKSTWKFRMRWSFLTDCLLQNNGWLFCLRWKEVVFGAFFVFYIHNGCKIGCYSGSASRVHGTYSLSNPQ